MKIVFNDPIFSSQLLRTIGETYYKGADIGECLSTTNRIREGDFESWHAEWLKTAKRIHGYANESLAKGHTIAARDAYLRASNYYRAAEFLLVDPHDPRIQTTWGNNKECFSKAAALFPFQVESIEIPYKEGATLTIFITIQEKIVFPIMETGIQQVMKLKRKYPDQLLLLMEVLIQH